ncbi:hypothetical protein BCR41DRAFT_391493 [Lobosporangium transversale]|uniref:Uncharacterized protein n=1 Tax=Lobosporangium transversale TaxID=64571 RepID=A0A1Y2H3E1_9FUNG|nr:hypothetical protein BCR41DRAFT_391493 [Lobosporangium transversale]ORZ29078.1 hypothetical protein BCR41DRAFT_391493 [Lobosporangium transversale]|eukprot:XP_021886751.1 hypothetical protein BCR41DRAFT_391493 [Lobosporangium transversale]
MMARIANSAEWASTDLINLDIFLEADIDQETSEAMAKWRAVLRQLGKLARLQFLKLIGYSWVARRKRTLGLRLRTGLDELVYLKSLRTLLSEHGRRQKQSEEATWT